MERERSTTRQTPEESPVDRIRAIDYAQDSGGVQPVILSRVLSTGDSSGVPVACVRSRQPGLTSRVWHCGSLNGNAHRRSADVHPA